MEFTKQMNPRSDAEQDLPLEFDQEMDQDFNFDMDQEMNPYNDLETDLGILSAANLAELGTDSTAEDGDAEFEVMEAEEDISRRQEYEKHFDFGAGRYQAVMYPEPVHYRAGDRWEEIDNNLEEAQDAAGRRILRNRANALVAELPLRADQGELVKIAHGGSTLSWRFEGEPFPVEARVRTGAELRREHLCGQVSEASQSGCRNEETLSDAELLAMETPGRRRLDRTDKLSEVTYPGILPGVSVRYTLSGGHMKEDVIVEDQEALSRVALKLPMKYTYEVNADQSVTVMEGTQAMFSFEMPVVYDALGATAIARTVIEARDEYTRLSYALPEEFLSGAVYPVTIDPVVKGVKTSAGLTCVYFNLNVKNKSQRARLNASEATDVILLGNGADGSIRGAALKFSKLVALKASDTITSAKLQLSMGNKKFDNRCLGAYAVIDQWDPAITRNGESVKKGGVTWKPYSKLASGDVEDYVNLSPSKKGRYYPQIDLTNLYRQWYRAGQDGNMANNGVILKCMPNTLQDGFPIYNANAKKNNDKPMFIVSYVSHAGLVDWGAYESMSAGRAGTTNVDLFNGNMVHTHTDTAMGGSRMPVSITHCYNSCQSDPAKEKEYLGDDHQDYYCGNGWKHSGLQRIYETKVGGKDYRVWVDSAGTEHWFIKYERDDATALDAETKSITLKWSKKTNTTNEFIKIMIGGRTELIFYRYPERESKVTWKHYWLHSVKGSPGREDKSQNEDTLGYINRVVYTYKLPTRKTVKGKTDYVQNELRDLEGMLDKITDGSGRVTQFEYQSGTNLLQSITTPDVDPVTKTEAAKRRVVFNYNASRQLIGIRYEKVMDIPKQGSVAAHEEIISEITGKAFEPQNSYDTTFKYKATNNNLLVSAINYDGATVESGYEPCIENADGTAYDPNADTEFDTDEGNLPPKNVKMSYNLSRAYSLETKQAGSTMLGAKVLFTYNHLATEVKVLAEANQSAAKDKKIIYQFDAKGNAISVRDELGFAQFVRYTDIDHHHAVTEVSKMRRAVVNLLARPELITKDKKINNAWEQKCGTTNTMTPDTSKKCLGCAGVQMNRSGSSQGEALLLRQGVKLDRKKAYTFSVYVSAKDVGERTSAFDVDEIPANAGAYLRIRPTNPKSNDPTSWDKRSHMIIGGTEDDQSSGTATNGWERLQMVYEPTGTGSMDVWVELVHGGDERGSEVRLPTAGRRESGGECEPADQRGVHELYGDHDEDGQDL